MKYNSCKVVKKPTPANRRMNPDVKAVKNPSSANRNVNTDPMLKKGSK